MAFIATPQGVETVIAGQQNGVPVVNVFHTDVNATVTPTILTTVNDIFVDWWTNTVLGSLSSTYQVDTITTTDISVINGLQAQETLTTGNVGGATGDPVAANAAMVISWRTPHTGRSFRGRTYIGALPASQQVDEHNMATTYAAAFAGYAQDLIDALAAAGYALSILSKIALGVARVTGLLTEIITIIVDTKIDSQRRRTAN